MDLTPQLYFENEWHDAASVSVEDPSGGYRGSTTVGYDMQYFLDVGSIAYSAGRSVRDARAMSVDIPIDLEDRHRPTWPPFLLDFLPQGLQRERIATHLKIPPHARSTDLQLLLHGAGSPVGNMRIKEAWEQELKRTSELPRIGVTMDEILSRSARFLEIADNFALLASGSSGLQGNWPKVAMTLADDGLWYPDSAVADGNARKHAIVKLMRSGDATDEIILRSEAAYSVIAKEFGLNVHERSEYGDNALIIPRFDRIAKNGKIERYGQESFVSAMGIAEFEHTDSHENYLQMLRDVSTDALADTTEYVLRDVLNLAMGNPDNHGRNTALRKTANGAIRLSPLFDFAPMRLSPASIIRSTKWECMRDVGRDHNPDWKVVCEAAAAKDLPANAIMQALAKKEEFVRSLPDIGRNHGLPDKVIDQAFAASVDIADGIKTMALHL
ncbi:MAG TPA: HipA domain-containing protein [Pseudolabrys sp.]|nr:HipA domain-containing protein [Pseudolabrys sp.]